MYLLSVVVTLFIFSRLLPTSSSKVIDVEVPAEVIQPNEKLHSTSQIGTVPTQAPKGTPKTYSIQIKITFCWP